MNTNPPSPRKPIPPAAQQLLHKRSGMDTVFENGFMLPNRNRPVSLNIHLHAHTYAWDVDHFFAATLHPTCLGNKAFLAKIICKVHSQHLYQTGLESLSWWCNRLQFAARQTCEMISSVWHSYLRKKRTWLKLPGEHPQPSQCTVTQEEEATAVFNTRGSPGGKQNHALHSRHPPQKDIYDMHKINLHCTCVCAFHIDLHSTT